MPFPCKLSQGQDGSPSVLLFEGFKITNVMPFSQRLHLEIMLAVRGIEDHVPRVVHPLGFTPMLVRGGHVMVTLREPVRVEFQPQALVPFFAAPATPMAEQQAEEDEDEEQEEQNQQHDDPDDPPGHATRSHRRSGRRLERNQRGSADFRGSSFRHFA